MELRDCVRLVWKRRWYVVITVLVSLALAGTLTAMSEPVYRAQAKLFLGARRISTGNVSAGVTATELGRRLLLSYATVIRTRPIAERAIQEGDLRIDPDTLIAGLSAEPILQTQIIDLRFEAGDPVLAKRVVNALAHAFVREMNGGFRGDIGSGDSALRVSIIEAATRPTSPVRPRPIANAAVGIMFGGALGVAIAFLVEFLDASVKTRADVERATGAAVLAVVPRIDTHGAQVYLERDTQAPGTEAFRKLRTAVQFLAVDRPLRTLLVTSASEREGKTTTSINLAASFAQAGLRTVLVEADLRRPCLHRLFPGSGQRGLTACLVGQIEPEQALLPTPLRNLHHIPAGAIPPNPAELLSSTRMADLLSRLASVADIVIVDAPPLLPVADASALASRVDGVVLVSRAGATNRDLLAEAGRITVNVGGRLLGVVLNGLRREHEASAYAYGYAYGYGPETAGRRSSRRPAKTPEA